VVTLTAAPAAGFHAHRLERCDSSSGTTCTVTRMRAKSVTATFAVRHSSHGPKVEPPARNGTVTSNSKSEQSNQIIAEATARPLTKGTVVTLRRRRFSHTFTGWDGWIHSREHLHRDDDCGESVTRPLPAVTAGQGAGGMTRGFSGESRRRPGCPRRTAPAARHVCPYYARATHSAIPGRDAFQAPGGESILRRMS